MSSSRPVNNHPPELRERAIRMVAEVRGEYASDWAAASSVADKLGIGTPQTVMNWVRKAQVDAGRRPGVSTAEAGRAASAARRSEAATVGQRHLEDSVGVFRRGGARPPTRLIVEYINGQPGRFGVAPVCRVLSAHGIPIAPSTHYDAHRREPSPSMRRDEELSEHIARVHAENFGVCGARKVWLALNREGVAVARCTVERLMKSLGLRGDGEE